MRVVVVDDVAVYRVALAEALSHEAAIAAVATACNETSAVRHLTAGGGSAIAVLNMRMQDSLSILRQLALAAPVVVLAMADDDDEVIACAEAGASGFLCREQPLTELLVLLRSVTRGETQCSPRAAATLLRRVTALTASAGPLRPAVRLTPREHEVLELVGEGLSNKQIARRLCIELRTAKNHVHHILEKYQVHRRADAAERFRATRFVENVAARAAVGSRDESTMVMRRL